jgi:hypothetical protein
MSIVATVSAVATVAITSGFALWMVTQLFKSND